MSNFEGAEGCCRLCGVLGRGGGGGALTRGLSDGQLGEVEGRTSRMDRELTGGIAPCSDRLREERERGRR